MIGIAYGYLVKHGGIGRYVEQVVRRIHREVPLELLCLEKDIALPEQVNWRVVVCDRNRSFMDVSENEAFSRSLDLLRPRYEMLHLHGLYGVVPDFYTAHICIAEYLDRNEKVLNKEYPGMAMFRMLERRIVEGAGVVAAASRKIADDLSARYGRDDIVVLPAASRIPINEKKFVKRPSLILGFVGGNVEEKGITTVVAVAEALLCAGYEVSCLGAGCTEEVYEAFEKSDVPARLLGKEDIDASFYDGMDVFLCLSPYEGVPVSALEAMARSVPVIGYAGQGVFHEHPIPESMVEDVTDVPAIAEKAYSLWTNELLWSLAVQQGLAVTRAYDWDVTAEVQVSMYRDVLGAAHKK